MKTSAAFPFLHFLALIVFACATSSGALAEGDITITVKSLEDNHDFSESFWIGMSDLMISVSNNANREFNFIGVSCIVFSPSGERLEETGFIFNDVQAGETVHGKNTLRAPSSGGVKSVKCRADVTDP
jgi:hypothetical protein